MKKNTTLILLLIPILVYSQSTQSTQNNIDPRQYINIYEINKLDKKNTIWKWESQQLTNQKRKIIDASSKIQIEFDKDSIASNTLFKGNITIEGQIVSTKGGEDPIEVFPYSRIGEEKRRIGVTSRPPKEIAQIFINLLIGSHEAIVNTNVIKPKINNGKRILADLTTLKEDLKKLPPNEFYFTSSNEDSLGYLFRLKAIAESIFDELNIKSEKLPAKILQIIYREGSINNSDVVRELESYILILSPQLTKNIVEKDEDISLAQQINQFNSRLKVITEYIDYFKSSGEQAEDVFLSFIQLDHILLDNIESKLKDSHSKINKFFEQQVEQNKALQTSEASSFIIEEVDITVEKFAIDAYREALSEMNKLTSLEGTILQNFLYGTGYIGVKSKIDYYESLIGKKSELVDYLAQESSKIIYLNLDYATIDLLKERGQEGDYLYIYVVLEENERRASVFEGKARQKVLPIGRYLLRNTGWRTRISDSFILAHRINEPDAAQNTNVSPSNFKGAPGLSLLLTRRKTGNEDEKLLNAFQPSIGIDVSYLDFSRDDDIEIGAGIILGLFDNQIFFSGGVNLNSTAKNEESPYYFGVGFSFANLANKFLKN